MKKIDVYTDGGCKGNGKENSFGAWSAIITNGTKEKVICGGELHTTNNKMELMAVIKALEYCKEHIIKDNDNIGIRIFSDSAYVVNAMNLRWVKKWINNGWITTADKPVANKELWIILNNYDKELNFQLIKVKGHDGNELNERCDAICNEEIKKLKSLYN